MFQVLLSTAQRGIARTPQLLSLFANKVDDGYGGFEYEFTTLGYVAIAVLIAVFLLLTCLLSSKRREEVKKPISTKQLVFSALAIALATVTSMLKLFEAPMGGSITLFSMLFVCLIGYWFGLKVGLTAAIAYGLLQLIIDPYVIGLPQLFMDYILAFGALGLSGIFHNKKHGLILGYLTGILGRFVFSYLSGLIFFAIYAEGSGMAPAVYSAAYNGSYIGIEAAITLILISVPAVSNALRQLKQFANEA